MELTHGFSVAAPVQTSWELLTDIERIAPCIPGFTLTEAGGDEYTGVMKVKVGAMNLAYDTELRFLEKDASGRRALIDAQGRERRGTGTVSARITANLMGDEARTEATLVTDLAVTGRVAQFGRGIMADVSSHIVDDFVACFGKTVEGEPESVAGSKSADGDGDVQGGTEPPLRTPTIGDEKAPLDLVSAARGPIFKRLAPVVLLVVVVGVVVVILARS